MAKKHIQMSVTLNILFSYDDDKTNISTAMDIAADLASEPNFHTIDSGVQLLNVDKVNYILK